MCGTIIYALLTNDIIVLWRSRNRSRRRFLNSPFKKKTRSVNFSVRLSKAFAEVFRKVDANFNSFLREG